ncbi:hypothetical protein LINGRAHAP2_LOCUS9160 [Linum grandiflorum]
MQKGIGNGAKFRVDILDIGDFGSDESQQPTVIAWCLVRIIPVHEVALVFYLSLYLSRLQKDSSDQKTSIGGVTYSDSPSSNAALFNVNYGIPSQERDQKGTLTVSSATSGRKRAPTVDIPDTHMPAKASRTDLGHTFGSSY